MLLLRHSHIHLKARVHCLGSVLLLGDFELVGEGEEAPDFTLQADDGREVSLSDYRGKKVVLYFYPKDGTPGCTREAVEFRDMAKEFEKEDASYSA